ncbi:type I-E CRISPR-associated protein Cse1/CasA [Butyrivibrio sp. AE3006]|uniref:type I-E CRISPR-associated protein Cse1/CasA n=1 Tax=Butyrivibrio sp. AE3006 TaxID=1280673 RepID=UPI0003F8B317|nr:type I-E CRISPR-associated protein Cse1/CasA [Butyrivibrio sp. AE3006]
MSLNLINQKFLNARFTDGHKAICSLTDILKQAHLIKNLEYNYPVKSEMYAMYRFLTQLATDIFRPADSEEIYDIFEDGAFDENEIDKYFEKYKSRFDLFDKEHPFMQTASSEFTDIKKAKTDIKNMSPLIRQGNNDLFYNPIHHLKDERNWNLEHTVYNLVFNMMCHVKTGRGSKAPIMGSSGATPLFTLYEADNLFTTVILGMDPVADNDIPCWRRDEYGEVYDRFSVMNYEFYPIMKVLLDEDSYRDDIFTNVFIETDNQHPIFSIGENELNSIKLRIQLSHPGTIRRYNQTKKTDYAEKSDTDREFWFNMGILQQSRASGDLLNTRNITEIMYEEHTIPKKLTVSFFGLYKGKDKPFRNIHSSANNIPSALLFDKDKQAEIDKFIQYIETSGFYLLSKSISYAKEAFGTAKETAPREYLDVREVFYRDAGNIFFAEYIKDEDVDMETYIKKIDNLCLMIFNDIPGIRGDVIIKRKFERSLRGNLSKLKEDIYGRPEKG